MFLLLLKCYDRIILKGQEVLSAVKLLIWDDEGSAISERESKRDEAWDLGIISRIIELFGNEQLPENIQVFVVTLTLLHKNKTVA